MSSFARRCPTFPFYAGWQCFTFNAKTGHLREVDLFAATPSGLYLIEIKSHLGLLTNQKSKELRDQLAWAVRQLGLSLKVPYVAPAVFLSDPTMRSGLDDVQRHKVYGRDGCDTKLPGIMAYLIRRPPRSDRDRVPRRRVGLDARTGCMEQHGPAPEAHVGTVQLGQRA